MKKPELYQNFLTILRKNVTKKFAGKMVGTATIKKHLANLSPGHPVNKSYAKYIEACFPEPSSGWRYRGNWSIYDFPDRVVRNLKNSGIDHYPQPNGFRRTWKGEKRPVFRHFFNFVNA